MEKINVFHPEIENKAKFHRRKDLTFEIRLCIAFYAMMSNRWGLISQLAKEYAISRTFVYMLQGELQNAVQDIFQPCEQPEKQITIERRKEQSIAYALSLRMEGKCSIPSISSIMERMGMENSSVGWISQSLQQIGAGLPNTIEIGDGNILYVYLAADEIFSCSRPLLISVDPISTAILRIELAGSRKTEDWINHFNELKKKGLKIVLSVSDEGTGICSAIGASFSGTNRQPDTFHAISHRLGKWVNSLEKSAYAAIAEEYQRLEVFESAKTESIMQKRLDAYFEAKTKADQAIMLYGHYTFLYHCIINNLQVFDKAGNPCNREGAEENIRVALDFMIGLPINKIKKEINTIYNLLGNLLDYLDIAGRIVKDLTFKGTPPYIIQSFSLAWQYQKNAIKAKNNERRKYFEKKQKEQLSIMASVLNENFETVKESIYAELDKIIQSSAIVENINSIVRTFLNTSRNKINQEMLNLIPHVRDHNHRRYKAGKRKTKTPMELLTGKKQNKDWLEMLLDIYKLGMVNSMAA